MLLPAILKPIFLYGGLVIGGFALIIFKVMWEEKQQKPATNLPEAKLQGKPKEAYLSWLRWVLLVGGLGLSALMYFQTTDVIVVTGDGEEVSAERKIRVFGSSDYTLAPDHKGADWMMSDPTWVVNRSRFTVKVVSVEYGRNLGFGSRPTVIPPDTAAAFYHVEHIGPDDPPPRSVRDEYKLGMDSRTWLTW